MNAMHLRVEAGDSHALALIETTLRSTEGIVGVRSLEDVGLASVLYDDRLATESAIVTAVRDAGVGARPVLRDRWP